MTATTGKILLAFFIFAAGIAEISAQRKPTAAAGIRTQSSFGMEEKIQRPSSVPKYVVEQMIASDERLSERVAPSGETIKNKDEVISALSKEIQGTIIQLNKDNSSDFLVQGDDGANITGFWLFRNFKGKWKLVLYCRASVLSLENSYAKGFRDVEIAAASAVTLWQVIYVFDGEKYVPKTCWEEPLGVDKPKRKYFKCSKDAVKPYS